MAREKEAAVAPALLLAKKWTPELNPAGWWMSEKLDGVRAYWDGDKFVSRLGHKFYAPYWFTAQFPQVPLDGELFLGRKQFQKCVSIVRSQSEDKGWKDVEYKVFDLPAFRFPFEERMAELRKIVTAYYSRVGRIRIELVEQEICTGMDDLLTQLAGVQRLGGEGLMLRRPASMYVGKRSDTLLKVKSFLDDEAVVVGHQPGEGKHLGRLGAVNVEWKGKKLKLGTGFTDAERESPPAIGSVVTFRYFELSDDGIPRFPTYVGQAVDK